ncbi:hypothetical protein ACEQ8H_002954 [Pleosporales sp. CAS-2024a]
MATAASVAAVTGAAAYLNAKYHIGQDIKMLKFRREATKYYAELVRTKRQSLWYSFAPQVAKQPNELCIWSRSKTYTWQETHDRAVQWSHFFLAQGVQPGHLVATYLMNSADFVVLWLGLFAIGCAPAQLNYNLKGDALLHCLKLANVKVAVFDSDPECAARFAQVREGVEHLGVAPFAVDDALLEKVYSGPTNVPADSYRENVQGSDAICLLYTSGTTGLPKAGKFRVNRFHERGSPDRPPFEQRAGPKGDRWYCCMPIFHGTGGVSIMMCLTSGISVAVGRKFSVSTFWDDIYDSQSTCFIYVGEAARYLLMAPPHAKERSHKLRSMYGNGLRPDVWNRFKERFGVQQVIEFFNSTEGVLGMYVQSRNDFLASAVGHYGLLIRAAQRNVLVPVAVDAETGDLIRDPKTNFVKRNTYTEGGEILVGVPSEDAFAGYYNNPQATAKKFVRDVFKKGDLYFRSGDALRRDSDGRWYFLDRLGDTFRWKSENVSTAEVAEVLGKFPGVGEAIVYGVLVPKHDGRAGCVSLRFSDGVDAHSFDWKAFLQYARDQLPRYAVPVFVRLVNAGSNTDNQKQNKAPLRDEGIELERFGEKVLAGQGDVVMWIKPKADDDAYVQFTKQDLDSLRSGEIML